MMKSKLAVLLLSLLPVSLLGAQNDPPVRPAKPVPAAPAADDKAMPGHGGQENDAVLANWLLVTNRNEMALAQIAVAKAHGPEVKQFAQTMLDEHGQFAQKLQAVSGSAGVGTRSPGRGERAEGAHGERAEGESEAGGRQRRPAEASGTRKPAPAGSFDHMALINDLGKKCLASSTQLLNEKSGVEFDRCYMRMQVAAHVQFADMLEVFSAHGSENLKPTLDAGLVTVKAHLAEAKTLCQKQDLADPTTKTDPATKIGADGK